jgi:biotin carboxylase
LQPGSPTGGSPAPHVVFVEMSTTGAGEACVGYCLERGYRVTVLARDPGRYAALVDTDRVRLEPCDTDDHAAMLSTLAQVSARVPVDAVTTTQDLYVPQAALAAAELGLPGMPYEAAAGVRNKYRMRQTLAGSCPELNPPFRLVSTQQEARDAAREWGYPVVAKPPNANDSWNVRRIDDEDELAGYVRAAASWSSDGTFTNLAPGILLEGFIDGDDYSVETVQYRGRDIELLAVSRRELMGEERGFFAEAGDLLPVTGPLADRLYRAAARALHHLGVDCGVIHTECRVSGSDIKIVEVNPRLAGNRLGSEMIEIAYGASAVQQVVETALDHFVPWRPTRSRGAGGYCVSMPRTGVFLGVENLDEVAAQPGVVFAGLEVEVGTRCHYPPLSNLDFVVRILTEADTPQEALTLARQAAAQTKVIVGAP